MSDDRDSDGRVDVSSIRERVEDDASENVMAAIEERAADGRIGTDAFAAWHEECRRERRSTADEVATVAAQFRALRDSLGPTVRDTNQVRSRIDEYEDEFDAMRAELEAVADRLADTPREPASPTACYEAADGLRWCERAIHTVAHGLHHVEEGVAEFETWLRDPATRLDEFENELGGFETYLDNTEGLLDALEAGGRDGMDPFDAWLAAHHLQRVMAVVFTELRTDLADLETWLARRDGDYGDEVDALRRRLASLEERHATCSDRLDATESAIDDFAARRAAVDESVERFETAIDDLEPPVDWGAVERLVSEQFDELGIQLT
ncbi:hypothetical protein ACFR97_08760 [Haloplanus litoreus]|uniref:Halo transducer protein n=1 Tax=Haloplanus litoreus TaxID=767515 RepID=A0ABD5ZU43_9EURY